MSEIIEEIVEPGTASAEALIVAIKTNADLSIEEAHAVIGEYYPEGEEIWRLEAYSTALYKVGGVDEVNWVKFRDYIHTASMETLGLILPQIRVIADIEIQAGMEIRMFEAMIAQLETEIAKGNPIETTSVEDKVKFFDENNWDVQMYNQNVEQLALLNEQLEALG